MASDKQKALKVVGISLDSLRPSIDRSQGSVSAFQLAMLIIPWQGACDTYYYESLHVRVPPTFNDVYIYIHLISPRTISYVDSTGKLCRAIAGHVRVGYKWRQRNSKDKGIYVSIIHNVDRKSVV